MISWLKKQKDDEIVGIVIHPAGKQKCSDKIVTESGLTENEVFFADTLWDDNIITRIRNLNPDIAVSVYFGYILKQKFIDIFPRGCINLHPAYLPYNRGANPNIWSIIDGTPAGVTLHYVNEKIDSGDIIAQKPVQVTVYDTGYSLYKKLERMSISLFKEIWPKIRSREIHSIPQKCDEGTYHRVADIRKIDEIELDRLYKAGDLINILRARTFPPHKGAFFYENGKRIYLRIEITPESR